ncbi:MAG: hypothetical protein P1V36_04420, partial [Planctomycetota bacterium]|nr:hypothetical protein [Planctomycetota bacterium]
MRRLISAFLLLLLLPLLPATAADGPLTNPGFVEWGKGLPAGWARSVGARQSPGDAPSSIEPLQGGGVALAGDAATRIWHMLSQRVTTKPQIYLELTYTARATGLKREAGQYG